MKTLLGSETASLRQQRKQRQETKYQDEREQAKDVHPKVLFLEIVSLENRASRFRTRHVASCARYEVDLRPLIDQERLVAVAKPG